MNNKTLNTIIYEAPKVQMPRWNDTIHHSTNTATADACMYMLYHGTSAILDLYDRARSYKSILHECNIHLCVATLTNGCSCLK